MRKVLFKGDLTPTQHAICSIAKKYRFAIRHIKNNRDSYTNATRYRISQYRSNSYRMRYGRNVAWRNIRMEILLFSMHFWGVFGCLAHPTVFSYEIYPSKGLWSCIWCRLGNFLFNFDFLVEKIKKKKFHLWRT